MKIMEIDLQNPIYSRDQVKVTTLVIFLFFWEIPTFFTKNDFQKKIISQKQQKTENHENAYFCNTP